MLFQIKIFSVGYPFKLRPSEREFILDVDAALCIVRKLVGLVGSQAKVFFFDAQIPIPTMAIK